MNSTGKFSFGGSQQSFSYGFFHADEIPVSLTAVICPTVPCEWICFNNDPDSTSNLIIGSDRLSFVGTGIVLRPGDTTGWIPANNLNLFWHKELDATTKLTYYLIGYDAPLPDPVILIEISRSPLLLEDRSGGR